MVSPFWRMGSGVEDRLNFDHFEVHSGSTRHGQWQFSNWRSVDYISLRQLQHPYYKLCKVPQKCKLFGFSLTSVLSEFISMLSMLGKASIAFSSSQPTWQWFEFHAVRALWELPTLPVTETGPLPDSHVPTQSLLFTHWHGENATV